MLYLEVTFYLLDVVSERLSKSEHRRNIVMESGYHISLEMLIPGKKGLRSLIKSLKKKV